MKKGTGIRGGGRLALVPAVDAPIDVEAPRRSLATAAALSAMAREKAKNPVAKPSGLAGLLGSITLADLIVGAAALSDALQGDGRHTGTRVAAAVVYPTPKRQKLEAALMAYERETAAKLKATAQAGGKAEVDR